MTRSVLNIFTPRSDIDVFGLRGRNFPENHIWCGFPSSPSGLVFITVGAANLPENGPFREGYGKETSALFNQWPPRTASLGLGLIA